MKTRLNVILVLISLTVALMPDYAAAGLDEGLAAYKNGDYATAIKELKPLAIQGNAQAQLSLGGMYEIGMGIPQNDQEAVKWYRLAADQGAVMAQYRLGLKYSSGDGVPQNYNEAVKWYRLAADQGDIDARFSLGSIYASGKGVPQNFNEAVKWYRLVADQGFVQAQINLGLLYANSKGMHKDYKEALKWCRLAADKGNALCQSNLGDMYAKGLGVPASKIIAYALYSISAENDPTDKNPASRNRTNISKTMTQKKIERGLALASEMSSPGNLLKALDAYVAKRENRPIPKKKKKK